MKRDYCPLSAVREHSPFATPPHIVVVADAGGVDEAVALAEALDGCGAEAEVRFADDATVDYHTEPDAVIFAGTSGDSGVLRRGSVRVALADPRELATGYDLVVSRPVNPSVLMKHLGERLTGRRN